MKCPAACCNDLDIRPIDLLLPHLLDADGQAFVKAHGLDRVTLLELQTDAALQANGTVKIKHRCAQLTKDNRCGIYATRPKICREFSCATRVDCSGPCKTGKTANA